MTVTARSHAMRNRERPPLRSHLGLMVMETLLTLSWTLLLGSVSRLLTSIYLYLLPLHYLIASSMVSWLECPVSPSRVDPLTAFGLIEASAGGGPASQWQTLVRVLLTPLMLVTALLGFIPSLYGRRSLPELLSGTRIVPLDPALDPRSPASIQRDRSRVKVVVRAYTVLSLATSALILLVPVRFESILMPGRGAPAVPGLSAEDAELLAIYLDLSSRNPDRLEFHVRLASLYYRNGMSEDLAHELGEVRRLDPGHAILILEEGLEGIADPLEQLIEQSDSGHVSLAVPGPGVFSRSEIPEAGADSTAADSLAGTEDEGAASADTLGADQPDSTQSSQGDGGVILPATEPIPLEIMPLPQPGTGTFQVYEPSSGDSGEEQPE